MCLFTVSLVKLQATHLHFIEVCESTLGCGQYVALEEKPGMQCAGFMRGDSKLKKTKTKTKTPVVRILDGFRRSFVFLFVA